MSEGNNNDSMTGHDSMHIDDGNRGTHTKNEQSAPFMLSLEEAGLEAAIADGVLNTSSYQTSRKTTSKKDLGLRKGKWTPEEEAYANRLILDFRRGLLPLADGTTLRTFLSKLLNCDPMRISKKFVGDNCVGKQVFRRQQSEMEILSPEEMEKNKKELFHLEEIFLVKLDNMRKREANRKGKKRNDSGSESPNESDNNLVESHIRLSSQVSTDSIQDSSSTTSSVFAVLQPNTLQNFNPNVGNTVSNSDLNALNLLNRGNYAVPHRAVGLQTPLNFFIDTDNKSPMPNNNVNSLGRSLLLDRQPSNSSKSGQNLGNNSLYSATKKLTPEQAAKQAALANALALYGITTENLRAEGEQSSASQFVETLKRQQVDAEHSYSNLVKLRDKKLNYNSVFGGSWQDALATNNNQNIVIISNGQGGQTGIILQPGKLDGGQENVGHFNNNNINNNQNNTMQAQQQMMGGLYGMGGMSSQYGQMSNQLMGNQSVQHAFNSGGHGMISPNNVNSKSYDFDQQNNYMERLKAAAASNNVNQNSMGFNSRQIPLQPMRSSNNILDMMSRSSMMMQSGMLGAPQNVQNNMQQQPAPSNSSQFGNYFYENEAFSSMSQSADGTMNTGAMLGNGGVQISPALLNSMTGHANSGNTALMNAASFNLHSGSGESQMNVSTSFIISNDHKNGSQNNHTSVEVATGDIPFVESDSEGSSTETANNTFRKRSISLENFWMLVESGDLPRPDQNILSSSIFESEMRQQKYSVPEMRSYYQGSGVAVSKLQESGFGGNIVSNSTSNSDVPVFRTVAPNDFGGGIDRKRIRYDDQPNQGNQVNNFAPLGGFGGAPGGGAGMMSNTGGNAIGQQLGNMSMSISAQLQQAQQQQQQLQQAQQLQQVQQQQSQSQMNNYNANSIMGMNNFYNSIPNNNISNTNSSGFMFANLLYGDNHNDMRTSPMFNLLGQTNNNGNISNTNPAFSNNRSASNPDLMSDDFDSFDEYDDENFI